MLMLGSYHFFNILQQCVRRYIYTDDIVTVSREKLQKNMKKERKSNYIGQSRLALPRRESAGTFESRRLRVSS